MEGKAANSLFYGFRGSSHYLNSFHKEVLMEEPNVKSHRKSRKHQRFLKYKEYLQQRGQHGTTHGPQVDEVSNNCSEERSEKLDKIKSMLCSLPTTTTISSASCDYDSGLSVSSSSASTRPSSPCSWLKPGKCVAIDCEMVGTGPGGRISELARCSIVNYNGEVLYDKYVKPELPITDYRTRWSGITRRHMQNAIPFKTAQKEILNMLKDKRVIGHALNNDFKALKYYHPKEQTRDTSKICYLTKMACLTHTPSLKSLAWHLLQKKIQVGRHGHSSVEDAQTCMDLYKIVEDQLEQDLLTRGQETTVSIPEASTSSNINHYMDDQYWPSDLDEDCK
ncbi:apoptosis-enhancing nuclease [Pyxicephalus adspersus]|uniref:Exonuclease XPMC2 n=1 Tax=Pyxicephalus adspersus TaxID=30357 RepID=A0AAV3AZI7_PYXAD|nr:TPA: hypothetical protein GDO54_007728 [Pyxicephalus adspersus]